MGDLDVLEEDVFDSVSGNACDGRRKNIVKEGEGRTQHLIPFVGTLKGNGHFDIADDHILEGAGRHRPVFVAQAQEDGIAGIDGVDILNEDVLKDAAVDLLKGNGGAEGVVDLNVQR